MCPTEYRTQWHIPPTNFSPKLLPKSAFNLHLNEETLSFEYKFYLKLGQSKVWKATTWTVDGLIALNYVIDVDKNIKNCYEA